MSDLLNFNKNLARAVKRVEQDHLAELTAAYEEGLKEAARTASTRFALTAAATEWQPPVEGSLISAAEIARLATKMQKRLEPVWESIVLALGEGILARVEIAFDVVEPLVQSLIDSAGQRVGAKLGEAAQYMLRLTVTEAYEEGLNVSDTSKLIQQRMTEAAPWQAEALARTDLNSLANGASVLAAERVGMSYKVWVATLDDRTRPEHMDAHGQTVPMNATFTVGGEDAQYPGDPNLSDAMAMNCRCTVVYGETLDEAEALLADGGGITMAGMKTRPRAKRHARRTAASVPQMKRLEGVVRVKQDRSEAVLASARPIGFSGIAAIEGQISDDNTIAPRVLMPDSLTWQEMPVSFLAQTVTAEGHDGAEVAGRVDKFARKRKSSRMRDIYTEGELTTPFGIDEIAPMLEDQTMRYVSADLGATVWALVKRTTLERVDEEEFDLELAMEGGYALGCVEGKIKALTLLATQAIEGAMVALTASADEIGIGIAELPQEALLAAATTGEWRPAPDEIIKVVIPAAGLTTGGAALVAAATPRRPPRAWFEVPEPPGKMPLTVQEDGQVYGHLATWDSCHASFLPSCVPPPRSPSNYGRFHTAYVDLDDGGEINVGKLMFSPDGGHADRRLNPAKASQYYDRTGMVAAVLRASDGRYGIWVCGSINPDLSEEQRDEMRRQLRLYPPSGDWRPYPEGHDLICGLAVSIPGFGIPYEGVTVATVLASATADGEDVVKVDDAIIASSGWFEPDPAALSALGLVDAEAEAEREMLVLKARATGGMEAMAALIE